MKKFLSILTVSAFLLTSGMAMATNDCPGGDCKPTVNAHVQPKDVISGNITINENAVGPDTYTGWIIQDGDNATPYGYNAGTADVTLNADALATGMDTEEWVTVGYEYTGSYYYTSRGVRKAYGYWQQKNSDRIRYTSMPVNQEGWEYLGTRKHAIKELHIVKGESESYGINVLDLTSSVEVLGNGFAAGGAAQTIVNAESTLDVDGHAWAEGTQGCPQEASIDLDGSVTSYANGYALSELPNGAYAKSFGAGATTVDFVGKETDASNYGAWIPFVGQLPNKAYVDFDSTIVVGQQGTFNSYISPDGLTATADAIVTGGYATLSLGRDGILRNKRDDIQLTGITAAGRAGQSAMAMTANGAIVASGMSSAYFSGANGTIETLPAGCLSESPGQTAQVSNGYAEVSGYNNVATQGNRITVTSEQSAYATTGNSGPVEK